MIRTEKVKQHRAALRRRQAQYQRTGGKCGTCPQTRDSTGQQLRVDDCLYCHDLCRWVNPAGSCAGPQPAETLSARIVNAVWKRLFG